MNKIENSRILITGGMGLVGSTIADQLLEQNPEEIILLDNKLRGHPRNMENALATGKVRFVEGDTRDFELMDSLVKGCDYVIHMAALRITRCAENPLEAFEVMARAPLNMIDLCVKHKVKKLVAASSASVYGQAEDFPTTEKHHPYNNRTFYGACKTFNELMYRSYKDMYGLDYNTFRYFNVFGPRMDTEGKYTEVLIRWYYLIKEGKRPKIFGEGDQTMDFVYIDDIARATILGLTQDVSGEDFNVARGEEVSLKELCNALLKAMDSDLEPEFVPLPEERQKVEVGRRLASTEKAEKLLGFKAEVELEDGLRRLVAWLDGLEEKLK
ncbi:NAD-dependent epimerase/dehydratase family protein [uncultured Pseudodesulfovibrio sp.]|uniref:NAD-dependent epimerase/dehydratase family protein n=1 Tax=uncultured Pseudodesulfovibrio sp. TaxID=2035858 RepID=UPI0029C93AE8|nr:NAD-dependent epimerase/dehydratase family protein [uncultured Pseudodesulfovibrio sp.]